MNYNFFLEVCVDTLKVLQEVRDNGLSDFPEITYSNLFKKVHESFHFEFELDEGNFLFSPYYTLLVGEHHADLMEFIDNNEEFLDDLKEYILNSLFVYSALIEENSYYLLNPQSLLIARMIPKKDVRFEIKFYTHYEDELLKSYKDKIYIGRDFLNLKKFDRKYLGLKKYFRSLVEQDEKIQERAVHMLRYFDDYKDSYLDEIKYLVGETVTDAMERIQLFKEPRIVDIPRANLVEVLDNVLYLTNLMIELRDLTQEFENKLRLRAENDFVKYLTKFLKDLVDGIRYLRKLSCQMHIKISNFPL